jgi:transposase
MRFVPAKSDDQLAVQAVHRIRSRLVSGRITLANRIRGVLTEHGVIVRAQHRQAASEPC